MPVAHHSIAPTFGQCSFGSTVIQHDRGVLKQAVLVQQIFAVLVSLLRGFFEERFYISQACSEDVFKIFQNQTCDSNRFISGLMDVFSMAGVHQQAEQPKYLAEYQTLL
jgi:hypothetical protein